MKDNKSLILMLMFLLTTKAWCQIQEFDFDYDILRHFGSRNGRLDTVSSNPKSNLINSKPTSIRYERDQYTRYDNIKIYPAFKLSDVSPYASHSESAPKITMKVFSSAPKGTLIEIQLGNKNNDNYPQGIHSQYQAYTTKSGEWEELCFKFAAIPECSEVSSSDVDKIIIVFSPDSKNSDTYYFDDLKGPPMIINQ